MLVLAALLHVSVAFTTPLLFNNAGLDKFEKGIAGIVNVSHLHVFLHHLDQDQALDYTGSDAKELALLKEKCEHSKKNKSSILPGNTIGGDDIEDVNERAGIEGDMYEGDIILTNEQVGILERLAKDKNATRSKRQAMVDAKYGWGNNPSIPYSFAASYPADRHEPTKTAMKFWSDNTCVSFRPATAADKNKVEVRDSVGCSSMVGKVGGVQPLNLAAGCMDIGTIAHELSHTLGIFHVQSRSDRDKYVLLDNANIENGMAHNFNVEANTVTYDIPYEFGSNMHYGAGDFARDKKRPVLLARTGYEVYQHGMMGRLPTFYDIMLVNKHYNCYANCPKAITCVNGGVVDVRNCNKCKCPFGWTGTNCSQRPAGAQTLTAKATPQQFRANLGTQGAKATSTITSQFYIINAPVGKRVEVTPSYDGTQWTNSCSSMGAIIQFKSDPRYAGVQICDFRVKYSPIVSEKNVVIIEAYTRGGQTQTTFNYRFV